MLSGGLDSATALAWCVHQRTATAALTIDYGQRHRAELAAAAVVAEAYNVPHRVLSMREWGAALPGALTGVAEVPDAEGDQRPTVVPNRNAVLVNAAAAIAPALGCNRVVLAVHAGDADDYPDCRPEWVTAARHTIELGSARAITLVAPFLHVPRAEVAALAGELAVPVARTWSCYRGGARQCGTCGACASRRAALAAARVADVTPYAA